ncbi:MAG: cytochrome-c oxidase, cbb3-type subunit III [Alphaproteobacteria bacterium]|nr:cytochrome-c oxidase, cbb3-type subunit III [Alphaproteobacteria bacterium]MBF0130435.1 cytochrome-c oxidase, cbb3-type subunit III [Alphaproteobacteria bacterium]
MAKVELDPVSGTHTTGHEWDGIKELNNPIPKWWIYVFYACVAWSVVYWIAYPAWPTLTTYTKGFLGYSSRAELRGEMLKADAEKAGWLTRFKDATPAAIAADPALRNYAQAGGAVAFKDNCAPCHQTGGAGAHGYPTLADDEWLWGGTLEEIQATIVNGVRAPGNANTRVSEMPRFGADNLLNAGQIDQVADYLAGLAEGKPADGPGKQVFAEQCAACHGAAGEGMAAVGAPALNNQLWLYGGGKAAVVAQIQAPRHGVMPAWGGRLDDTTIKQLTVYVHSLGGGK